MDISLFITTDLTTVRIEGEGKGEDRGPGTRWYGRAGRVGRILWLQQDLYGHCPVTSSDINNFGIWTQSGMWANYDFNYKLN